MPETRPSVVQIADFGGPYSGNFIASLRALERTLAAVGLRQVYAFSDIAEKRPWLQELRGSGAQVYLLPKREGLLARTRRIRAILKSENAAVVHTHFTTFDVASVLAALSRGTPQPKVVWHIHSALVPESRLRRAIKDTLKLRLLGRTARAVVVSESLREELRRRGMPISKIRPVANAINIDRIDSIESHSRVSVREEFGIAESTTVLLMFGWHGWIKGVDVAIEAISKSGHQDLVLLIVGDLRTHAFIRSLFGCIPERVIVVPPRECVAEYYRAADAFLSASRSEGMSYSVGEAMAARLPVILSDIPGNSWAVSSGVTRFASENAGELATMIAQLSEMDEGERNTTREANRDFVITTLSLDRWAEQIVEQYDLPASAVPAMTRLEPADVDLS